MNHVFSFGLSLENNKYDFQKLVHLAGTSYLSRWLGNSLGCNPYFGDFDPSVWRGQFRIPKSLNFSADA